MSAVRLTGWPPLATLFQALLAAAVLTPIVLWFAWVFVPIYTKDPSRVLIGGGIFGLLGIFLLLTFVRLAMRWIVRPSVTVEGDLLVVRVRRRRWWLFDRMEEHRIRLEDIRALRFETSHRTSFTIDTAAAQIALPPAMFAIGPHSLDAAIRAHVPHERFPDPLAEVETLMRFRVSRVRRVIMYTLAALPPLGTTVGLVAGIDALALGSFIFYVPWLAIAWLALVCRGEFILDPRGLFHEGDGNVGFIAWSELDLASVHEFTQRGLANLEIRSTRRVRGTPTRIRLTRFLGLGFPNKEIGEAVLLVAREYR